MNYIGKIIILCIALLGVRSVDAENQPKRVVLNKVQSLSFLRSVLTQSSDEYLRENAFKSIEKMSNNGVAEAMNTLALIYLQGIYVQRDTVKALMLLEQASAKKHPKAQYNLFNMYRTGIGAKQDFEKAYRILIKSDTLYPPISYGIGYNLYKGYGCTQDYAKAVRYFRLAAKGNHKGAMYMLGLCYRNGYGVKRNNGQANYWLNKSADQGDKFSMHELVTSSPQNPLKRIPLKGAVINDEAGVFQTTSHKYLKNFTGHYFGSMFEYDWSGAHIIREVPIKLDVATSKDTLKMNWIENENDTIRLIAKNTSKELQFSMAYRVDTSRYSQIRCYMYKFATAQWDVQSKDDVTYLSGNVQFISMYNHEPYRPTYLSLQKVKPLLAKEFAAKPIFSEDMGPRLVVVYPNPVKTTINIDVNMLEAAEVEVKIYGLNGTVVHHQKLGMLNLGRHHYALPFLAPLGSYFVAVKVGAKEYVSLIVKKE